MFIVNGKAIRPTLLKAAPRKQTRRYDIFLIRILAIGPANEETSSYHTYMICHLKQG
jgi:hypothetical protein